MVDILSAVLSDGLVAVEAACAEALGDGVHSADVILNILVPTPRDQDRVGAPGRQREPGPSLTIATPVALRLGCEPMADCARPHPERGQPQGRRLMERSEILDAPNAQGAGLKLLGMKAAPGIPLGRRDRHHRREAPARAAAGHRRAARRRDQREAGARTGVPTRS